MANNDFLSNINIVNKIRALDIFSTKSRHYLENCA